MSARRAERTSDGQRDGARGVWRILPLDKSLPASGRPSLEIRPLSFPQRLRAVVAVVEFRIQMAGLEAEHRPVRGQIYREAPVSGPQILAIGRGCGDGRFADWGHLPGYLAALGPGVAGRRTPENPVGAKLNVHYRLHRFRHRTIVRGAEGLQEDLA